MSIAPLWCKAFNLDFSSIIPPPEQEPERTAPASRLFVRSHFSLALRLASVARLPLGFRFRCCLRKELNLLVALNRIAGSINWTPETKTRNKDRDDRQARIDARFVICTLTVPRMATELGFGDRTLLAAGLL